MLKHVLFPSLIAAFVMACSAAPLHAQEGIQEQEAYGALVPGEPQERTLAAGTVHAWEMQLETGQYIELQVEQKSIDVVVRAHDPFGVQLREVDESAPPDTEKLTWITKAAGTWRVSVLPFGDAASGMYEIRWVTAHEATEEEAQILKADSLDNLAGLYLGQGRIEEAEPLMRQALALREETHGPEHLRVATGLNNLAAVLKARGRYEEAEPLYSRAVAIMEAHGPENPRVATGLNNLASLYNDQGRYREAEPLYKRALALWEKALGPEHPNVAVGLYNLASLYKVQGRYEEAEPLMRRALALWEKALGPEHPNVAAGLNNLAAVLKAQGRYEEAEPLYRQALALWEKALGPEHPRVAVSLNNLASLYLDQGRYREAEPLYRRALAIREKALRPEHPQVATSLNNLAGLYWNQGRYGEAEPLYRRALTIREKVLGPEHPNVAVSLNNLAHLYKVQGRYGEAEPLYRRALALWEKALGPEHPDVAASLNNLAGLYVAQGRREEAEPLYRRALTIREKVLGPEHPRVAASLNNLAGLYVAQGRREEAEPLYRRALTIREKVLGPEHPDVAASLNNLASLYKVQGRFEEAEPLYTQALAIQEKALGPEHPRVAVTLIGQADLYGRRRDIEKARPLFDRAIAILDATMGSPKSRIEAYALRATLHHRQNQLDPALLDLEEALRAAEELRPEVGGGEETRAHFFEGYADDFDRMVTWLIEADDPERAFHYAERGRARVLLDQLAAGKIDLRADIPSDIRAELEAREMKANVALAEYQQRITMLRAREDLPVVQRLSQIATLQDSLRVADRQYKQVYQDIKNASPLWRDLLTSGGQIVALATLQRSLLPRQGLMLLYQIGKEQSHLFVIPPRGGRLEALPLLVADTPAAVLAVPVGPLTATTLQAILSGQPEAGPGVLEALSTHGARSGQAGSTAEKLNALWQTLVPEVLRTRLIEASEVIIIPDGALHYLPFESLVIDPGEDAHAVRYWLDAGPIIRYAPSATALYNISRRPASRVVPRASSASMLSLSDPIYNPADVEAALADAAHEADEDTVTVAALLRPVTRDRYERVGGSLARLPGTARETDVIKAAYGTAAAEQVVSLQGLAANEPNLRSALVDKRYVHLATHGLVDERRGVLFASLAVTPPAGAATALEDDGFLQLHEIYTLKLVDTELAVLSACESNVGERVDGEGVFALSRGFLAAGARRVVASQWSVDDASTAALMGHFFRRIVALEQSGQTLDYALALREAKLAVRRETRWSDPYYWAPFILTGK